VKASLLKVKRVFEERSTIFEESLKVERDSLFVVLLISSQEVIFVTRRRGSGRRTVMERSEAEIVGGGRVDVHLV
jgi:hypothetical protein